jgi:hypothetical protein
MRHFNVSHILNTTADWRLQYLTLQEILEYETLKNKQTNNETLTNDENLTLLHYAAYLNTMFINDQLNLSYATSLQMQSTTPQITLSTLANDDTPHKITIKNYSTTDNLNQKMKHLSLCQKIYNSCCKGLGI